MALNAYLFNCFAEDVHKEVHNFGSDTFKVALSNTAPSATDTVIGDITQIASGNGYTTDGQAVTITSAVQTGGKFEWTITSDLEWTAGPSSMAEYQYYVLWNVTAAKLVGWWDRGAGLILAAGRKTVLETGGQVLYEGEKAS